MRATKLFFYFSKSNNWTLRRYLQNVSTVETNTFSKGNNCSKPLSIDKQKNTSKNSSQAVNTESDFEVGNDKKILDKLKLLTKLRPSEANKVRKLLTDPLSEKEEALELEIGSFMNDYKNLLSKTKSGTGTNDTIFNIGINGQPTKFPFLEPSLPDKPYTSQELRLRQWNHSHHMAKLGADTKGVYSPIDDILNPPTIDQVDINKLMAANVHLGQSTSTWRPATQSFIYGRYKGVHLIDLNNTMSHLKRACKVIEGIAEKGGIILFLGTKPNQKIALEKAATRIRGYFVCNRWIPGTLTNSRGITGGLETYEVNALDLPTKRELSINEKDLSVKPDLLVVLNPTENRTALHEAMKCRVPTIGIIDTDSEPCLVTYPIPGNDDSSRSVNLILGILSRSAETGLKKRLQKFK